MMGEGEMDQDMDMEEEEVPMGDEAHMVPEEEPFQSGQWPQVGGLL